jgi:uncharacterized protein
MDTHRGEEAVMKCPVDGTTLALAERAGVEIDYCPECRGMWLDRGELDRIMERSASPQHASREDRDRRDDGDRDRHGHDRHDHDHDHDHDERYGSRDRKRGSAFGALTGLFGGED